MIKPSKYERTHWKLFNFLAKLFGVLSVLICSLFIVLTILSLTGMSIGQQFGFGHLFLFVPLLILGILMIKAEPYYPKEYKKWLEQENNGNV